MMKLQDREQQPDPNSQRNRSSQYTSWAIALPTVSVAPHGRGNTKWATVSHERFAHPSKRKPEFLAVVRKVLSSAVPRHRFRCIDKSRAAGRTPKPSALFSKQSRFFTRAISIEGSKGLKKEACH
jgi:hypothetical protein